ncbi:MAG: alpha-D-glucose phosphate-specific phosphoglucomutase [Gammaproteobacteria bacterium]
MKTTRVKTRPFTDQKPGTAGLRKRISVFRQPHYLENFVQAIFDCIDASNGVLIVGGDGRFHNRQAVQSVARLAAGNGARRVVIGRGGLLSTPAASGLIRSSGASGGFILTASHNPGGPDGDFGIKFNTANGGQASEKLMEEVYARTLAIESYRLAALPEIDIDTPGLRRIGAFEVEVVDPVEGYASLMEKLFDFDRMRSLLRTPGFSLRFDAMHAVTGPYAVEILERRLGAPEGTVVNGIPLEDFGGGHPDPNPMDAANLVRAMGTAGGPLFGAASDGDGDRNMILGRNFLVSPGDSLAVLAAQAPLVPGYRDGLAGVARSMPTSRAVDRVAAAQGVACHETPTGWRFFCNLLDAGRITLCGEESFGTSSDHVREKDGLWAVLFWLDLQAATGLSVEELVRAHWAQFGRNFFARHDFSIADTRAAEAVMRHLGERLETLTGRNAGASAIARADVFRYVDPVDGSVSENQGTRIQFEDDSRIVYRQSGTGTQGATLRVYLERYAADTAMHEQSNAEALAGLAQASRDIARIPELTGLNAPTAVI